jgi:hypothetical protein
VLLGLATKADVAGEKEGPFAVAVRICPTRTLVEKAKDILPGEQDSGKF